MLERPVSALVQQASADDSRKCRRTKETETTGAMVRSFFLVPAMLVGLAAPAPASQGSDEGAPAAPRAATDWIKLAQDREIEVYFDGRGNRVIVDAYTGEVLAVQPPRRKLTARGERRLQRLRELGREERFYLGDPEEMAPRRRRQIERQEFDPRFDENLGPVEEYDPYAEREFAPDEFPEAPRDRYTQPEEPPPDVVRRKPLPERQEQVTTAEPEFEEAAPRTEAPVISVEPVTEPPITMTAREDVAAVQILMDRAAASPGVIDGRFGSNVDKALAAYNAITGQNLKSTDAAGIKAALAASGGDPFTTYTITAVDAAGPYVASIPVDYGEKAKLTRMAYTSVSEALAERFHMDEAYLKALNPDANFSRPGTVLRVANIGSPATMAVSRIVADKGRKQVRAYDSAGKIVAAYPATIGSSDTPSPTGTHTVSRVAFDPDYTYNPKLNFKQGDNDKVLTIPPGPNGPVGSIWIALDKPTYGIHGTPDPSKIGKTESHGCVRLTNWDAQELAKLVSPGVTVEFTE